MLYVCLELNIRCVTFSNVFFLLHFNVKSIGGSGSGTWCVRALLCPSKVKIIPLLGRTFPGAIIFIFEGLFRRFGARARWRWRGCTSTRCGGGGCDRLLAALLSTCNRGERAYRPEGIRGVECTCSENTLHACALDAVANELGDNARVLPWDESLDPLTVGTWGV